jgi:predicted TIM-barrel fold metal-dependent hydrolase
MIATCKAPAGYLVAAPLPMQDPAAAADEAERAVKELRMPVVVIGTNVRGKNLDMPEFWPFFARINELNIPIIIHSDGRAHIRIILLPVIALAGRTGVRFRRIIRSGGC